MAEFDAWIGFIVRWAATGVLAAAIVGLLAYLAFLPLEYTWRRLPLAGKVVWLKLSGQMSNAETIQQVEKLVRLERARQQREHEEMLESFERGSEQG